DDRDEGIYIGGRWIFDRHAGRHQFSSFLVAHDSAHCRQLDAAVDASNLVGIRDRYGFHAQPTLPVDGDEIRKVELSLCVLRSNASDRIEQREFYLPDL